MRNAAELLIRRLEMLQDRQYTDVFLLPHLGKHYFVLVGGGTMNIYGAEYNYVPISLKLVDGSELHVYVVDGAARIVGCS